MLIIARIKCHRTGGDKLIPIAARPEDKLNTDDAIEKLLRSKRRMRGADELIQTKHVKRVPSHVAFQLARDQEFGNAIRAIAKAAFTMGKKAKRVGLLSRD